MIDGATKVAVCLRCLSGGYGLGLVWLIFVLDPGFTTYSDNSADQAANKDQTSFVRMMILRAG